MPVALGAAWKVGHGHNAGKPRPAESGNPRGAGGPSKGAPGGLFSAPRKSVGGIAQTRPVQGGRGGQQLTLREVSRHVAEPVCRVRQVTRGPPGPRVCFSFRSQ